MADEQGTCGTGLLEVAQIDVPDRRTTPHVAARMIAPMPGVITFCEKYVGEEVQAGDVVLILEAMKMENLVTAPVGGKVLSLHVKEGEKVEKGTVLGMIG